MTITTNPQTMHMPGNVTEPLIRFTATEAHPANITKYVPNTSAMSYTNSGKKMFCKSHKTISTSTNCLMLIINSQNDVETFKFLLPNNQLFRVSVVGTLSTVHLMDRSNCWPNPIFKDQMKAKLKVPAHCKKQQLIVSVLSCC